MASRSAKATRSETRCRYYARDEAARRGWRVHHPQRGGACLEENEITAFLPDIGLGLEKPDFVFCIAGMPALVVEAKNHSNKIDEAIKEAIDYCEQINAHGTFRVRLAVGAAGEPDTGFTIVVRYLAHGVWVPLTSRGIELTSFPSLREVELAMLADDGSTTVTIPAPHEFVDAAIDLSIILRSARVEAPLRPKVIGALVMAMYQGQIDLSPEHALDSVNSNLSDAINGATDLPQPKKDKLIDALELRGTDFERLATRIGLIVNILRRLNVRAVLNTDADFLGMFYEAFLRYGYDNNALGIVFTPRHITGFCVDLTGITANDRVIDIAAGTGGFLVAAFDRMLAQSVGTEQVAHIKQSLYGFDTNPTVWALATLNMFFRGDGKSHIEFASCLEPQNKLAVARSKTRAYLNPPFSQENEPEKDFLDAAMAALEPGGMLAAVVYAGVFADEDHQAWRKEFLRRHTLLGMVSLPEELFYPTAAPTTIVLARAHIQQPVDACVFMARIWNDGFQKLKNRRVARDGSQLPLVKAEFDRFMSGQATTSPLVTSISAHTLLNGQEWSPQQWLPQPPAHLNEIQSQQRQALASVLQCVAHYPDLADAVLADFGRNWSSRLPLLPKGRTAPLNEFFEISNGKSTGEKNYADGDCPYVSSGDSENSVVREISPVADEVFEFGAITVTAFGTACLQPWPFMARGNGGSAVRVLTPRYEMSTRDLIWFVAQINLQKWRFFYARMSIKGRISRLEVNSPPQRLLDDGLNLAAQIAAFRDNLTTFSASAVATENV